MPNRPKPTALKILQGNPSKRKIRPEPSAPAGAPPMPKRLTAEPVAVAKWRELVPILLSMGVLTTGDGEALATLCEVHAAAQSCLLELRAGGVVMKTDLGGVKPNPAGPLFRALVALQATLMGKFGLTPSSRTRLAKPETKTADPLDEFLTGAG